MKTTLVYIITFILTLSYILYNKNNSTSENTESSLRIENLEEYLKVRNEYLEKREEKKQSNKNPEEEYYRIIGDKYRYLSKEENEKLWQEILSRPSEPETDVTQYGSWTMLGPYGIQSGISGRQSSGRVKDLEFEGLPSLHVASASGGLWKFIFAGFINMPIPISDNIPGTLNFGAFAVKPGDTNTIFAGTGEPAQGMWGYGKGLWRTQNGGQNWENIPMYPEPLYFYKIKYHPGNTNIIHAVTNSGYYRSDNLGNPGTWVQRYSGQINDIAINPSNPNIIYIIHDGTGLFKSIDGGNTFSQVTSLYIPSNEFGRSSISICHSNPSVIYLQVTYYDGSTRGIYKTTNDGISWADVSWRNTTGTVINFHWNQGAYNNCIAVCPTNPNLVLAGGGSLLRTINGGLNWYEFLPGINNFDIHPDQHVIKWHSNGTTVWVGNDGGIVKSINAGATWSQAANTLPITQFNGFDAGVLNNNIIIAGGTQDNAIPITLNAGYSAWNWNRGGDGWKTMSDENNPATIFVNWNSAFEKTTNGGLSWSPAGTGINSGLWVSNCSDDRVHPVEAYIGNGNSVLKSLDMGTTWTSFTTTTFPTTVWRVNVSRYSIGGTIVYAILWDNSSPSQSRMLRVYDNGIWYNRAAGLPLTPIRYVAQHPRDNNKAYLLTEDYGSTQKVFKSNNRGINWVNITGDLPNIAVGDLVPHPTNDNVLYLGSHEGMWRTTNGGLNWHRWTNGMPQANRITAMTFIDSVSANKFYVLASSYGRGVWIRDASAEDVPIIGVINNNEPVKFELGQNYPNPFNPSTLISFSLPAAENVELKVYDALGKEVASLINSRMEPGKHSVKFDGASMSSGVYFYKINAGRFTETKKMILIK